MAIEQGTQMPACLCVRAIRPQPLPRIEMTGIAGEMTSTLCSSDDVLSQAMSLREPVALTSAANETAAPIAVAEACSLRSSEPSSESLIIESTDGYIGIYDK
jgi:hypothetical protein